MRVFDSLTEAYKQGYAYLDTQRDGFRVVFITLTREGRLCRALALVKPA